MIRRNLPAPKKYKVIKNERGITVSEECALVVRDCEDVTFEGGDVDLADRNGIYFQRNCHGNTIRQYRISRAGAAGIYLDSGCTENLIESNSINQCGYWLSDRNLAVKWDLRRFGLLKREGIAIDDARGNTVRNNTLSDNALAAVTLYRNCGEFCTFERGAGANDNHIHDNNIMHSKVGIWNQARSWRDLSTWDCLDDTITVSLRDVPRHQQPYSQWLNASAVLNCLQGKWENPFRSRIEVADDIALNNTIANNRFIGVKHEIING